MRRNRNPNDVVDTAPEIKYARNELEKMQHEEEQEMKDLAAE